MVLKLGISFHQQILKEQTAAKSAPACVNASAGTKNLRIIDAETGETLSTSDFEPGFIDDQAYPGWSPDGTEILFTSVNPASAKVSGSGVMAQDYNSSRSNKPRTGIEIDTDRTDFNVMHVVWSPAW